MPKKRSKLVAVMILSPRKRAKTGAEVEFVRLEEGGQLHTIHAIAVDGSYSQWGAPREILGDNVDAVTKWAKHPDRLDPAMY